MNHVHGGSGTGRSGSRAEVTGFVAGSFIEVSASRTEVSRFGT